MLGILIGGLALAVSSVFVNLYLNSRIRQKLKHVSNVGIWGGLVNPGTCHEICFGITFSNNTTASINVRSVILNGEKSSLRLGYIGIASDDIDTRYSSLISPNGTIRLPENTSQFITLNSKCRGIWIMTTNIFDLGKLKNLVIDVEHVDLFNIHNKISIICDSSAIINHLSSK